MRTAVPRVLRGVVVPRTCVRRHQTGHGALAARSMMACVVFFHPHAGHYGICSPVIMPKGKGLDWKVMARAVLLLDLALCECLTAPRNPDLFRFVLRDCSPREASGTACPSRLAPGLARQVLTYSRTPSSAAISWFLCVLGQAGKELGALELLTWRPPPEGSQWAPILQTGKLRLKLPAEDPPRLPCAPHPWLWVGLAPGWSQSPPQGEQSRGGRTGEGPSTFLVPAHAF